MLVPEISILFQTLIDDAVQFGWHIWIQPYCRGWCPIQNGLEDYARTLPTERQRTCRHFVQDGTKREQVRSCIQFLGSDLLRRHIGDGAKRRTGAGEMLFVDCACHRVGRCNLAGRTGGGRHFRQSKVQNLGVPSFAHKDVRWLYVAVDDSLGMGRIQRVGNVNGDGHKNFRFEWTPGDAVRKRRAVQKLHHDERLAFLLADLVNRADVGVIQGRRGTSFPAEAFERLRVCGNTFRQEL